MLAITAVTVDNPCRVRLYENFEAARLDHDRPATVPPARGESHGVILDINITEDMDKVFRLSPVAFTDAEPGKVIMVIEPLAMVKLTTHVVGSD